MFLPKVQFFMKIPRLTFPFTESKEIVVKVAISLFTF